MNAKEKKELKLGLYNRLSDYYSKHSFKLLNGEASFEKDEFKVFWGPNSEYSDRICFTPSFSVKNKKIYDVKYHLFPNVPPITISKVQGPDLVKELGLFNENNAKKMFYGIAMVYSLRTIMDYQDIVEHHIEFMKKVGFVFFDKLKSLEDIHNYINGRILKGDRAFFRSSIQQVRIKIFFDKRKVLSGIIAAYLINSPDVNELLERHRLFWKGNNYMLDDVKKVETYFNSNKNVIS